jgi:hypothetical protein
VLTTETEEGLRCSFRKGPEKNKEPMIVISSYLDDLSSLDTIWSRCGSSILNKERTAIMNKKICKKKKESDRVNFQHPS